MDPIVSHPQGVILKIHVQPRAKKTEIVGRHGQAVKIRLAAPPVDGRANEALVAYLAKILSRPRTDFSIISGAKEREKKILIRGATIEEVTKAFGV